MVYWLLIGCRSSRSQNPNPQSFSLRVFLFAPPAKSEHPPAPIRYQHLAQQQNLHVQRPAISRGLRPCASFVLQAHITTNTERKNHGLVF